jgi:hypothetical protein
MPKNPERIIKFHLFDIIECLLVLAVFEEFLRGGPRSKKATGWQDTMGNKINNAIIKGGYMGVANGYTPCSHIYTIISL